MEWGDRMRVEVQIAGVVLCRRSRVVVMELAKWSGKVGRCGPRIVVVE